MIVAAIDKGVSAERIATVLNVNIDNIKRKLNMLNGISEQVIILLKNYIVAHEVFAVLRKMKEPRQIEVAELMIAANRFSKAYADMMLAGTKPEMLTQNAKKRRKKTLSPENIARMQQEMEQLQKIIIMLRRKLETSC